MTSFAYTIKQQNESTKFCYISMCVITLIWRRIDRAANVYPRVERSYYTTKSRGRGTEGAVVGVPPTMMFRG